MRKFIITEEEKHEILKKYNLREQQYDPNILIGSMSDNFSRKAGLKSRFLLDDEGDAGEGYVKFLTWMTDLQPTIEKMFGVNCKESEDIEKSDSPGEFGYAGKCDLIWSLITKILNLYLLSDYSPIKGDSDGKKYFPVLDWIKNNQELQKISNQVFRGQSSTGEKYNTHVTGGVYISPNSLENAVVSIYRRQRNFFN
jgi:hypothetical protein